jgi:hypothetical protein
MNSIFYLYSIEKYKLQTGLIMAKKVKQEKKCPYNWHMAFRCVLGTAFYVLGIAAFIKYLFCSAS